MRANLRSFFCLLVCVLLAFAPGARGGMAENAPERLVTLFLNTRESLTGADVFRFTPAEPGAYAFRALPFDTDATADISLDGAIVKSGALPLEVSLDADSTVEIRLSGGAGAFLEVMRVSHGRDALTPITITEKTLRYTKSITNPRDVHWYAYVAPSDGLYTFRTETADEKTLDTAGYLFDENGGELGYGDDVIAGSDPNFRIYARLAQGQKVLIRVSAFSNDTGLYRLVVVPPDGGDETPVGVELGLDRATLNIGESITLTAAALGENAYPDLVFSSSDSAVARVSPDGAITARAAGEAIVTVSGYGGVSATCRVTVRPIELQDYSLGETDITIPLESSARLEPAFTPENASDTSLVYRSGDEQIAKVDADGVITAVSEGACDIYATSPGGLVRSIRVTVTPREAMYRALVLGEHQYDDGRTRVGAINTAQGVSDMLASGTNPCDVTLMLDSTFEELLAGIETAFAGAREGDVSVFYINCHGESEGGVPYFELHDGTRVTSYQLEQLLRPIPGNVVVLLDFCQSGAFLPAFPQGKYFVLASATDTQDSYRMGSTKDASEAGMATVFARALCEGAGWDLMRDKSVSPRADRNRDGRVTISELFLYAGARVMYHLEGTGATQTVTTNRKDASLPLILR